MYDNYKWIQNKYIVLQVVIVIGMDMKTTLQKK